jgi:hypothetical protein
VAMEKIQLYTSLGFDRLPVNMAKTPLSLSHDANRKGAPRGFTFPVRDLRPPSLFHALCGRPRPCPSARAGLLAMIWTRAISTALLPFPPHTRRIRRRYPGAAGADIRGQPVCPPSGKGGCDGTTHRPPP